MNNTPASTTPQHQHLIINTSSSALHHQHPIINTPPSILHQQPSPKTQSKLSQSHTSKPTKKHQKPPTKTQSKPLITNPIKNHYSKTHQKLIDTIKKHENTSNPSQPTTTHQRPSKPTENPSKPPPPSQKTSTLIKKQVFSPPFEPSPSPPPTLPGSTWLAAPSPPPLLGLWSRALGPSIAGSPVPPLGRGARENVRARNCGSL